MSRTRNRGSNRHCQLMFYGVGIARRCVSEYKAPSKRDACVSPQLRRCHKPPLPLSLREPRQPPQQPPRRTGAWPTPPPQQGSKRAAGERPKRLPWFRRRLLPHLWSPSLCPSAFARPPRKETSCGLRPRGGCWWSDLAPKEREVNSTHLHPGATSGLIIIGQLWGLSDPSDAPVPRTFPSLFCFKGQWKRVSEVTALMAFSCVVSGQKPD